MNIPYDQKTLKTAADILLPGEEAPRDPISHRRKGGTSKLTAIRRLYKSDPVWRERIKETCNKVITGEALESIKAQGWGTEPPEATPVSQDSAPTAPPADCEAAQLWREVQRIEIAQDGHSSITDQWLQGLNDSPDRAAAAMLLADRLEAADRQFQSPIAFTAPMPLCTESGCMQPASLCPALDRFVCGQHWQEGAIQ